MSKTKVTVATLKGATILQASVDRESDELVLLIRPAASEGVGDIACFVMADPEGNGPGSLHVNDFKTGRLITMLGGR